MYIGKRGAIIKIASKLSSLCSYIAVEGRVGLKLTRRQLAHDFHHDPKLITIYKKLARRKVENCYHPDEWYQPYLPMDFFSSFRDNKVTRYQG